MHHGGECAMMGFGGARGFLALPRTLGRMRGTQPPANPTSWGGRRRNGEEPRQTNIDLSAPQQQG